MPIGQTLQFMLQINRQYRQEKPSSSMRGNRIQALKLMGYHYIQQNNKKFSSRLIYVLLEGLVNLFTHNNEAQMLITGSEEDRVYVGEAIELLMREKIEGKIILGGGQGQNAEKEVGRKNRRIQELQLENKKLKEAFKEQREKYEKEAKKGNKIYHKCQHITDMLFEMKEKHQLQKKNIEELHDRDLSIIIEENRRLEEQLIREKTIISILKEQNAKLILEKQIKRNINVRNQVQSLNKRLNFVQQAIQSITIQPFLSHFSLNRQQINEFIKPFGQQNKLSITSSHSNSIFPTSIAMDKCLSITKQVFSIEYINSSTKIDASTEVESNSSTAESIGQSLSVCSLNRVLQRRLLESQLKLKEREEQYQKLVRYYNCLHDQWEAYKVQTCSNIEWLSKQLEKSLLNTDTSQDHKSPQCITSIDTSSESEVDRLQSSRQSTERSMTPINRVEEESIGLCNSFVLRQRLNEESNNMIGKQVISTYILQLMDKNSQGQRKEVMIDQIGACLGWGEKQFQRIDIFRRKAKTSNNPPNEEAKEASISKQGIGDRFYRFLTLQSDVEE